MFEGKEITFIEPFGTKYKAIVISCTKDIGITIKEKVNNEFLYCLVMKNAHNFSGHKGRITRTRKRFTIVRKQIIAGVVDFSGFAYLGERPSAKTCPFGQ